jgi:hypothetical protein
MIYVHLKIIDYKPHECASICKTSFKYKLIFSLEYAGELHIIILREEKESGTSYNPTPDLGEGMF